ncbi:MAG: hypothetical protein AAF678_04460 [Pseudomonadota bacterium]
MHLRYLIPLIGLLVALSANLDPILSGGTWQDVPGPNSEVPETDATAADEGGPSSWQFSEFTY